MTANNMTERGSRLESIGRKLKIPSNESRSAAAANAPASTPSEQSDTGAGPKGQLANYVQ